LYGFIIISRHALRSLVPFIVGAITWLYLQRTAISDKTLFVYRALKVIAMACFHRIRRPAARSAEVGNSIPLL
jgi:hypothetical protein